MPKRLLILATDLEVGGVPLLVKSIALGLDPKLFDIHVACLSQQGPISDELTEAGIATYALNAKGPWDIRVALRLAKLLAELRPEVLFTALVHANFMGRLVGRLMGVRHIFASIHTTEKKKRWHLQLENLFCRLSDKTVCISKAVLAQVRNVCHVPESKLELIPNGIDADLFINPDTPPLDGTPSRSDKTTLIFVGRLDGVKGVDVLIRAISMMNDSRDNMELLIVGDGPQRNELQALTHKLRVSEIITFLGTRRDIAPLLKNADIKVMPSYWEGLGIAAIEAMAAGIPVIASNVAGLNEVVRHEVSGILVPAGDPEKLADAITSTAANPRLCKKWGQNGRKIAIQEYSFDKMIKSYTDLYN